jgi:hypothetical protein
MVLKLGLVSLVAGGVVIRIKRDLNRVVRYRSQDIG